MATAMPLESIDSRLALRVYAGIIGAAGFALAGWGQIWLGSHLAELPWGRAVLIRLWGAVMMGAALCAYGVSSADLRARRRMLFWFIAAHAVVWLMVEIQAIGPLGDFRLARQVSAGMMTVILGLLYVRVGSDAVPRPPLSVTSPAPLRPDDAAAAHDEQQIREAAAQGERNRLARELHDAVKQQIFAIQTSAATAEARFEADPGGAREAVAQVRQSAREAMAEMEAMLEQLRVAPLGNTGLVEAIKKHGEALAFRTGADVEVQVGELPTEDALPPGTHQAMFRIVQEALANVGRHARARHVWVTIDTTTARLEVQVRDDGVGFDRERRPAGMGIHNMRARAAEIGGSLEIVRADGTGTLVTLSVPLETSDARKYRRRQAFLLTILFGFFTVGGILNLLENGPALANVFVVFFALAFVHHFRNWLGLRSRARRAANTAERIS